MKSTSDVFGAGGVKGLGAGLGSVPGADIAGSQQGTGWARDGTGPGADGRGLIGIGSLSGPGPGGPRGGTGFELGKRKYVPQPPPDRIRLSENYDRELVRRVVLKHWNELKSCYEVELSKNPNLAGKVAIGFVINPVGDIGSVEVTESTMESEPVKQCILRNVQRWQFPAPKGGGVVEVTYPFIFQTQ
jgi:TonB family protein